MTLHVTPLRSRGTWGYSISADVRGEFGVLARSLSVTTYGGEVGGNFQVSPGLYLIFESFICGKNGIPRIVEYDWSTHITTMVA